MLNEFLTKEQVKEFNEYGYIVIKGFYDRAIEIEPIQYGIWQILKILFEKYHIDTEHKKDFSPDNFDYGYQKLIAVSRRYGGELYSCYSLGAVFFLFTAYTGRAFLLTHRLFKHPLKNYHIKFSNKC